MKKVSFLEMIATTGIVVLLFCSLLLALPQLRNEVSAAWAQGVLTVLGLGAAMYSANRQAQDAREHAQELRNDDLKQKRQGIMAIAEAAFDEVERIERACNNRNSDAFFEDHYYKDQFHHVVASLKAIPLHELHSYNMVVGILELTDALLRNQVYCETVTGQDRGSATAEEYYYAYQDDNFTKATHALTFIRGGILGWTTEQINYRNGLQEAVLN